MRWKIEILIEIALVYKEQIASVRLANAFESQESSTLST